MDVASSDDLSQAYCDCMTSYCFGVSPGDLSDEECIAIADALPRSGSPTTAGDSIECRIGYCQIHITSFDDADCYRAAGQAPCAP